MLRALCVLGVVCIYILLYARASFFFLYTSRVRSFDPNWVNCKLRYQVEVWISCSVLWLRSMLWLSSSFAPSPPSFRPDFFFTVYFATGLQTRTPRRYSPPSPMSFCLIHDSFHARAGPFILPTKSDYINIIIYLSHFIRYILVSLFFLISRLTRRFVHQIGWTPALGESLRRARD